MSASMRRRKTSGSTPEGSIRVVGHTSHIEPADLTLRLAAIALGDHSAFESVYDELAPAVYGVVKRILRDPVQSEEVTQEVLLEVWRAASRFDARRGSPVAWVMTIAHRRAIDRVRANQRSTVREQRAVQPAIPHDEVADTVEVDIEHARVRHCLGALTHLQREAVMLAYYGGYSYPEVALLLGVPTGTVKTRMRDGLIRLRDCLGVGQ